MLARIKNSNDKLKNEETNEFKFIDSIKHIEYHLIFYIYIIMILFIVYIITQIFNIGFLSYFNIITWTQKFDIFYIYLPEIIFNILLFIGICINFILCVYIFNVFGILKYNEKNYHNNDQKNTSKLKLIGHISERIIDHKIIKIIKIIILFIFILGSLYHLVFIIYYIIKIIILFNYFIFFNIIINILSIIILFIIIFAQMNIYSNVKIYYNDIYKPLPEYKISTHKKIIPNLN